MHSLTLFASCCFFIYSSTCNKSARVCAVSFVLYSIGVMQEAKINLSFVVTNHFAWLAIFEFVRVFLQASLASSNVALHMCCAVGCMNELVFSTNDLFLPLFCMPCHLFVRSVVPSSRIRSWIFSLSHHTHTQVALH